MENRYKKVLLDTNIISAILRHPMQEGKNYLNKFIMNGYITCISINSILELRKTDNLYEEFLNTFNMIPTLIIKPPYVVIKEELTNNKEKMVNPILCSCDMFNDGTKLESFLSQFLKTKDAIDYENYMDINHKNLLKQWYEYDDFKPHSLIANKDDADIFIKEKAIIRIKNIKETLRNDAEEIEYIEISKIPTLQMMLYSQYYRVYDASFKQEPGEINDVIISSCAPYFDAVLIENKQGEIIKKVKKRIQQMNKIEIFKMKDIR